MKKNTIGFKLLGALVIILFTLSSCKDRRGENDMNNYDSLPEQERLYGDPDPLNETDQSGGTIDNHLAPGEKGTPASHDTLNRTTESTNN